MARSRTLVQCRDLQNLAYEEAMKFKTLPSTDEAIQCQARRCQALAQVTKAWEATAERARILRGRPLPGSLRPADKERKAKRSRSRRQYWEDFEVQPIGPAPPESQGDGTTPDAAASPQRSATQVIDAPPAVPKAPPTEPCASCEGKGTTRNVNFGIDCKCTVCKGTGVLPRGGA